MRNRLIDLVQAALLILMAVSPAGAVEKNFPAGSWIIPMADPYQSEADQGLFEAYGFVWELLSNGVTVYWIVDGSKTTIDAVDFTVSDAAVSPVVAEVSHHGGGTMALAGVTNTIDYLGGPWVIHADDVATARAVLSNAAWDQVNLHEANVAFAANVQRELSGTPPKIALMNDIEDPNSGNAIKILASYLVLANICGDAYELVTPFQVRDGVLQRALDPFTLFWAPHWAGYEKSPYDSDNDLDGQIDADQITGKVREFLEAGNSMFAECASIEVFEHSANGHFLTDFGIGHDGGTMNSAKMVYNDPTSVFAQTGNFAFSPTGGHLHNWRPFHFPQDVTGPPAEPYNQTGGFAPVPNQGASYNPTVTRFVHDDANGLNIATDVDGDQWDYYVGGYTDGDVSKGYVVYLGGHSYGDASCAAGVLAGGGGGGAIPGPAGVHRFSIQFDAPPVPGTAFDITVAGTDEFGTSFTTIAQGVKVDGTDVIAGTELQIDFSGATMIGSLITDIAFTNTTSGVLTITEIRVRRSDSLATPYVTRVWDQDVAVDFYNGAGLPLEAVVPVAAGCTSNYQIAAGTADRVELNFRRRLATNNQQTVFTVTYNGGQQLSIAIDQTGRGNPLTTVTSADGALQLDFSATVLDDGEDIENAYLRNLSGAAIHVEAVAIRWNGGDWDQRFRKFEYQDASRDLWIDARSVASGSFALTCGGATPAVQIAPPGVLQQTLTTSCGDNSACGWRNAAAVRYVLNTLFNLQFTVNDREFSRSAPIVDVDNLLIAGSFDYPSWRGHVRAYDATTPGSSELWDAAAAMPAADGRTLFTNTGGVFANGQGLGGNGPPVMTLFTTGQVNVLDDFLALTSPVDADTNPELQVINRIRGKRLVGVDPANPAHYVEVANRLGAIEHSAAAVVGPTHVIPGADSRARVAYVGSLDGILHAVDAGHQGSGALDAGTGRELWGFIPGEVLSRLQNDRTDPLSPRDFAAVDASPTVADVKIDYDGDGSLEPRTVLVGATGPGGKSIFALDISDPNAPALLWETTDIRTVLNGDESADTDSNGDRTADAVQMGHAYKTAIGRVFLNTTPPEATYVTYVATGYALPGTGDGGVRVYCFRLDDGAKLWEFYANYGNSVNDIPGALTIADSNDDGFADWVFAGDNNGRLWQLSASTGANPYGPGVPLYNAGVDYPIATSPAVAVAGGQIVLFFGTGGADWAKADANHIHKVVAVKAGPPAHHPDAGAGVGEVLFSFDLGVGEKVFASPVLTGNVLFVGTVVGTVESADPNADIPVVGAPVGSLRVFDVTTAMTGAAGAAAEIANLANQGNFRATLHIQNDALYGTTIDGTVIQIGTASTGGGVAIPPVERFFWRKVQQVQ